MKKINTFLMFCLFFLGLTSCSTYSTPSSPTVTAENAPTPDYAARIPKHITTSEKTVVVDPNVHVWGAYDQNGDLLKAGLASAGADYCPDLGRRCHTQSGTFHVESLGSPECKSSIFPLGKGGAPMPYCMFFNRNQALHGTGFYEVREGNISHGCVRMHVEDAHWLRYNFVNVGTKVVIRPY